MFWIFKWVEDASRVVLAIGQLDQVSQSPEVRRELLALRQLRGEELWVSYITGGRFEVVKLLEVEMGGICRVHVVVTYHHSGQLQKLNLRSYK